MKFRKKLIFPFVGLMTIALAFLLFIYEESPNKGVIIYETNLSNQKILEIKKDFGIDLSVEELEKIVNRKTKLYFNNSTSKWYKTGLSKLEDFSKKDFDKYQDVELYVYNDYASNQIIKVIKILGTVVYNHIDKNLHIKNKPDKFTKVLGKNCREVVLINEQGLPSKKVYYTLEIPYPIGPENYLGLEGAILKVEDVLNNNEVIYEAVSIERKNVNDILSTTPDLDNMFDIDEFNAYLEKANSNL